MTPQDAIQGMGLGLITGGINDRRQVRQQEKLQALAIEGQKEMADYNVEKQMDLWNRTNYNEQRKQLEKAGLNVGLLYGKGGMGGSTAANTGNVQGASAQQNPGELSQGMALTLQAQLQKAQIENIAADTKKKEVEANKLAGVDTAEAQSRIKNLAANTDNTVMKGIIMNYEKAMAEVDARIKDETQDQAIATIAAIAEKVRGEAKSAQANGTVDESTVNNAIQQIQQANVEQNLRIASQKIGLTIDQKQLEKMAAEIANISHNQRMDWNKWEQGEKERWIKEKTVEIQKQMADFQTGGPAQAKQMGEAISAIIRAATLR